MKSIKIKNHICLTGPASVGKSFISKELSARTGLGTICIDDIISFAENELFNGLTTDESRINQFKLKSLMLAGYNYLSPAMQSKQQDLIDEYIEKYKFYTNLFGDLEKFHEPIIEYNEICSSNSNPSTEFVVLLTQRLHLKLMSLALESINSPIIIDTPAPLGFKPTYQNENGEESSFIASDMFIIPTAEISCLFENIMKKCGTKVFLVPGIDYEKRNASNDKYNQFLVSNLENYYDKADIIMTVNGMFTNPESDALKSRIWLDVFSTSEAQKLTNKSEISNICDTILEYVAGLESSQMQ